MDFFGDSCEVELNSPTWPPDSTRGQGLSHLILCSDVQESIHPFESSSRSGSLLRLVTQNRGSASMTDDRVEEVLRGVQSGELSVEAASERLSHLPFVDTEHARVDTHRAIRQGIPEVIFGLGKTAEQIAEITEVLKSEGQDVLVTRVEKDVADTVQSMVGPGDYDPLSRLLHYGSAEPLIVGKGKIVVVCAGTP